MLRAACIEHKQGGTFNTFLEQVASKYENDKLRADFWTRITDSKVSLISKTEVADVDVTEQAADEWLKKRTLSSKVCYQQPCMHLAHVLHVITKVVHVRYLTGAAVH